MKTGNLALITLIMCNTNNNTINYNKYINK